MSENNPTGPPTPTDPMVTRDKPATIYDVARRAGVSHQTVSRYLAGYQGIRPATREKVELALDALGYRVNLTARSLRKGRSHRVAALTHDISQVGPSKTAQGAIAAARERGQVSFVINHAESPARLVVDGTDLLTGSRVADMVLPPQGVAIIRK